MVRLGEGRNNERNVTEEMKKGKKRRKASKCAHTTDGTYARERKRAQEKERQSETFEKERPSKTWRRISTHFACLCSLSLSLLLAPTHLWPSPLFLRNPSACLSFYHKKMALRSRSFVCSLRLLSTAAHHRLSPISPVLRTAAAGRAQQLTRNLSRSSVSRTETALVRAKRARKRERERRGGSDLDSAPLRTRDRGNTVDGRETVGRRWMFESRA